MGNLDRLRQKHETLSPLMQRAHEKAAREVFNNPDSSIQERDFDAVYGKSAVDRDIAVADRLEKLFKKSSTPESENAKKIAEVFEAVVITQAEMSNWLGHNVHTLKTSRFDDYVNKVDMLAEWTSPQEGKHLLALAVDVTFSTNSVRHKLEDIKREIDKGQLGSVRYFKDVDGHIMGTRLNVPRAVIGVSEELVGELAAMWVNGDVKSLAAHPVQKLLVEQMYVELARMRAYALETSQQKVVQAYDQALGAVKKLRDNQMGIMLPDTLKNDRVWRQIAEQSKEQFTVKA